ncbi:MAG: multi-sensor signal transduction histidine kinase [Thermoleophilia bacterium]|nr:multi-sensor signal transduction histidine kinase [Thermoleophilia bacterium]
MGLSIRTYVAVVSAAAAGSIALAAWLTGMPASADVPGALAFAVALVFVQLLPIPFPRGSQLELVRIEEAVVLPMLLLLDPVPALAAATVGILVGNLVQGQRDAVKVVFNVAQLVLSVAAALAISTALTSATSPGFGAAELAAAGCGLVGMFLVNQVLVAGVMRVAAGVPFGKVLFEDASLKGGMWVANAALGTLLVLPAIHAPWLLLVALVPLAMLHAAWRVHSERAGDEQRLRELEVAIGGLVGGAPLQDVARILAEGARDVVEASGAEVRIFDGELAYWAQRGEDGSVETGESRHDEADAADDRSRVALTVPLTGGAGAFGELKVWHERSAEGTSRSFTRRDRTLLEMLRHQAASALDNARLSARSAQQQRTIAQVFEHSSEGMLVLDSHGRVQGWNPAMRNISGFDSTTVTASPISLISPQLAAIATETGPGTMDAVVSTADGTRRHVRASYAPIEGAGQQDDGTPGDSWVVVVRDVTSEQETERLKDDFVATVSHELRTPLTAIKGFLDTMQRDDIELGAGQVRMFLQIMGEQADRLERLIGDLLDMSAIESGRPLEVDIAPIDLTSTVRDAIRTFEVARPNATVSLDVDDVGLVIAADGHRLEQVVTNLLDNAVKHGGDQDPVRVRVHRDEQGAACVTVADSGPGISLADQRHVFDRFFVTADSVTRTGGGAGLGLYICRRLVASMEGEIGVRSAVGDGTSFDVSFATIATSLPTDDRAAKFDEAYELTLGTTDA